MTREMAPGRNERSLPTAASSGPRAATGNSNGEPGDNESSQEERQPSHKEGDYLVVRGEKHGIQPTTSNRAVPIWSQARPHKALSSRMRQSWCDLGGTNENLPHARYPPVRFPSVWVSAAFYQLPTSIGER
jgi:hypothetical protein